MKEEGEKAKGRRRGGGGKEQEGRKKREERRSKKEGEGDRKREVQAGMEGENSVMAMIDNTSAM
ncbi:hypothetical protein, partial [Klebsiella pneumoniae]|uniref:hypothetical protein n=1 Tax=Klebsiella pneumoniae TaxID=573 RepID=UPI003D061617